MLQPRNWERRLTAITWSHSAALVPRSRKPAAVPTLRTTPSIQPRASRPAENRGRLLVGRVGLEDRGLGALRANELGRCLRAGRVDVRHPHRCSLPGAQSRDRPPVADRRSSRRGPAGRRRRQGCGAQEAGPCRLPACDASGSGAGSAPVRSVRLGGHRSPPDPEVVGSSRASPGPSRCRRAVPRPPVALSVIWKPPRKLPCPGWPPRPGTSPKSAPPQSAPRASWRSRAPRQERALARLAELLVERKGDARGERRGPRRRTGGRVDRGAQGSTDAQRRADGRDGGGRAGGRSPRRPGWGADRGADAGQRTGAAEGEGAAWGRRGDLRGPAERDCGLRRAHAQERQRDRAPRLELRGGVQRGSGGPGAGGGGRDRPAGGLRGAPRGGETAPSSPSWPPRKAWWI